MSENLLLKQTLSMEELSIVNSEFQKKAKSKLIAYVLWFTLGIFGAHRFYTQNTVRAVCMLFTLGGLGVWSLIDVFFIGKRVEYLNEEIERQVINNIKTVYSASKEN